MAGAGSPVKQAVKKDTRYRHVQGRSGALSIQRARPPVKVDVLKPFDKLFDHKADLFYCRYHIDPVKVAMKD